MTMAKARMDLNAFVGKLLEEQDGDVLREGIRVLSQALMETGGRRADRRRASRADGRSARGSATGVARGHRTRGWGPSSSPFRR